MHYYDAKKKKQPSIIIAGLRGIIPTPTAPGDIKVPYHNKNNV